MRNKKLIEINGIEYQLNGAKLQEQVEKAIAEFQKNTDMKGSFWDDLKETTGGYEGLARTTVIGWYEKHLPRNSNDILKLIDYLGCGMDAFLSPIAFETECLDEDNFMEKVDQIIEKRKKLHIGYFFLAIYLEVFGGYEISIALLWKILRRKKIPSEKLCSDILKLMAIVEHNSKCDMIDPFNSDAFNSEDQFVKERCSLNRVKMQQLGLDAQFVSEYLRRVKRYKIDTFSMIKVVNGFCIPSVEFCDDWEEILNYAASYIMYSQFPLTNGQIEYASNKKIINNSYVCKKSIPIVFSLGENRIHERLSQIKRIENFAKTKEIVLNEMYIHYYQDSSWYNLRNAVDLVEAGHGDSIILYSRNSFVDIELRDRFIQYAVCHNVPVIFLEDMYYM